MQILSKRALATAALAAALAGCGSSGDHQDLRAFMEEVQARPPGRIEPLPPFEQVPPFAYQASNMRSPFEPPAAFPKTWRNHFFLCCAKMS